MSTIQVIADDTDVFALLLHFNVKQQLSCHRVMVAPSQERSSVNIKATAEKHADIIGDLCELLVSFLVVILRYTDGGLAK